MSSMALQNLRLALATYLNVQGGDHTPLFSIREKLQMHATFTDAIRRRRIFTVYHGNAVCY